MLLMLVVLRRRDRAHPESQAASLTLGTVTAFAFSIAAVPGPIETYYLRYAFVLLPLFVALAWAGARLLWDVDLWHRSATAALLMATALVMWQAQPWTVVRDTLRAPSVTPFPLADVGRAATIVHAGMTSVRADVTPRRHLTRQAGTQPCRFVSDADVAFAVGRAVAELTGCDAALPPAGARYRLTTRATDVPAGARELYSGRAFRLLALP
jgi:hypothetical protein